MSGGGIGPGGPNVSSAKKRRLAALEQRSGPAPAAKRPAGDGQAIAQPPTRRQASRDLPKGPSSDIEISVARDTALRHLDSDPVYSRLPETATAGAAVCQLGLVDSIEDSLTSLLDNLMATNPRTSDSRAIAGGKLRDKAILLDNPAGRRDQRPRGGGGQNLSSKLATNKEQRAAALYELKNSHLTHQEVLPLNRRWQEYVQELLIPARDLREVRERLHGADLHGCSLKITEAPDARHIGLEGIVVRDSRCAFHLITHDNRLVVIPKKPCVFEYRIDQKRVVTLLGTGLVGAKGAQGAKGPKRKN